MFLCVLNISEVLLSCSMRDRLLLLVLLVRTTALALPFYQIFLFQASLVVAVDRSKFKSCSQSGFCKRCRAVQPGVSTYQVRYKEAHKWHGGGIQTNISRWMKRPSTSQPRSWRLSSQTLQQVTFNCTVWNVFIF